MIDRIDQALTVPERALDFTAARAAALARNVANASVPGYRRVDVSFAPLLAAERESSWPDRLQAFAGARPHAEVDAGAPPGPDGNNVVLENELVQIHKNGLVQQLAVELAAARIASLRLAISGRG